VHRVTHCRGSRKAGPGAGWRRRMAPVRHPLQPQTMASSGSSAPGGGASASRRTPSSCPAGRTTRPPRGPARTATAASGPQVGRAARHPERPRVEGAQLSCRDARPFSRRHQQPPGSPARARGPGGRPRGRPTTANLQPRGRDQPAAKRNGRAGPVPGFRRPGEAQPPARRRRGPGVRDPACSGALAGPRRHGARGRGGRTMPASTLHAAPDRQGRRAGRQARRYGAGSRRSRPRGRAGSSAAARQAARGPRLAPRGGRRDPDRWLARATNGAPSRQLVARRQGRRPASVVELALHHGTGPPGARRVTSMPAQPAGHAPRLQARGGQAAPDHHGPVPRYAGRSRWAATSSS